MIITDIIMGNLLDSLKDYFDKTPQDVLEKDFEELEYLNEIGPDAIAYVEYNAEKNWKGAGLFFR